MSGVKKLETKFQTRRIIETNAIAWHIFKSLACSSVVSCFLIKQGLTIQKYSLTFSINFSE